MKQVSSCLPCLPISFVFMIKHLFAIITVKPPNSDCIGIGLLVTIHRLDSFGGFVCKYDF